MANHNHSTGSSGFSDVNQLIRSLFEPMNAAHPLTKNNASLSKTLTTHWIPTVDVKQEANQYIIHADVPGVPSQQIEVSVSNGNTLLIKGRKDTESEKKSAHYVCLERSSGSFYRSLTLPSAVNAARISAKVKNGVLEIIAPKLGGKQSTRKIKVKAEK